MPSLAEVHGNRGGSSDDEGGTGEQVCADDAAQVSLPLSTTGVLLFLLGIGFAFFFDSLLGTVGYLLALGLGAWGLARWIVATVPDRNLPAALQSTGRPSRSRSRDGWLDSLRDRLQRRGGTRSRGLGGGRSRRNRSSRLARVRDTLRSRLPSLDDGDRL
jgi:hypothetical protein